MLNLYYEFAAKWEQMIAIVILYMAQAFGAWIYAKKKETKEKGHNNP